MELFLEDGYTSVNKNGEELCGDNVASVLNGEFTTLVLADGLGSGVKANILSILTSKILCTMVSNDIDMQECVETMIQTLPTCKVRGLAYSTFSVVHVNKQGQGYLFEFDNPDAIYYHNGRCADFDREPMDICGKKVFKTKLDLVEGDVIIVMSDGAIHAGIGATMNLGWKREDIMDYLDKAITPDMSARCISCLLTSVCNGLYLDQPGDDTTVAAVRIRKKQVVNIMVGPPLDKDKDDFYVEQFLSGEGKKVVCGGTSSQIVAKYLGKKVEATFDCPDRNVPPIAKIDGIDLATEGVLTIRKLLELCEKYLSPNDINPKYFNKTDGASQLAQLLFERATHVNFFVGQTVNLAHQGLPIDTTLKLKLIESLSKNLKDMGKIVVVNYD